MRLLPPVPLDFQQRSQEDRATFIARYLRRHHAGINNGLPAPDATRLFRYADAGTNGRHGMRSSRQWTADCQHAVTMGHPIAAGPHGYCYLRTAKERDQMVAWYDSFRQPWTHKINHLQALEFDEGEA